MREPKYLAIHCTATRIDQDVSIERVKRWHLKRGWSDVGYHYYVRKDGSLELGRDRDNDGDIWEEVGAHVKGFNRDSISMCYEGGLDVNGEDSDTRTPEQMLTMEAVVKIITSQFKNIKTKGHRDFPNVKKSCPNFDVKEWLNTFLYK